MDTLVVALRVVLSLAVVLGLLWVLQRRLARGGRLRGNTNLISVLGRQSLGQKASVVVVEIDGRRLVLGVTEAAVTVLHGGGGADDREEAFAQSLAVAASGTPEVEPPLEFRPRRKPVQPSRIAGSILSPATWQQTAAALRQER